MSEPRRTPKVSVVIPNYNHARFLRERLRSVLDQTLQDFEIIYLDDASTDDSNAVFAEFAHDPRMRAVFNQTNSGVPFKQWNKGVGLAQGQYVWIAESDDYADSTLLAKLVALLDRHPNVGLAYCQSLNIDEKGKVLGEWLPHGLDPSRWQGNFINGGIDECARHLVTVNTIPNVSAVVFRKDVYEKAGRAPEDMRLAGDWLTWLKMLRIADVGHLAEPLNYFRRSAQSVSVNAYVSALRVRERYVVSRFILDNFDLQGPARERVLDKLLDDWLVLARSRSWWLLVVDHLRILPAAIRTDPGIFGRLAGRIASR